jgi:tight adherence protein C
MSRLGGLLSQWLPRRRVDNLNKRLSQAGHPSGLNAERFVAVKVLLGIVPGLFLLAIGQPIFAALAAVCGFFAPDYWLLNERDKRQNLMRGAAADTIDQLTITVEAGLGFDAALMRVANSNEGPLAEELRHTVSDVRAGVPRDQALKALSDRTQIPEIKQLVTALVQAQRHGTPLAETLRVQAAELRDKRLQRIEETAAKIQVKMIFPIIFCFVPCFFIVVGVPAVAGIENFLH